MIPQSFQPHNLFVRRQLVFLVLFVFSGVSHTLNANNGFQVDEKRLQQMPDDTAKVNLLIKYGEHFCSTDNEKALVFLQEAFSTATLLNYTQGIGKSLLWQGRVYYYKDNYALSNKYFDKAQTFLEQAGDVNSLAFLYFAKGTNSMIQGDFINAMEKFKEGIKYAGKSDNKKIMSACYNGMGTILLSRKEEAKALEYFRESLALKKEANDKKGIAKTYNSIGKTYESLNKHDTALFYFNKALNIFTGLDMKRSIASSAYQVAGIHLIKGEYAEAEKSLLKAIDIFKTLNEKTGIVISELRLALVHGKQKKALAAHEALSAFEKAKEIGNPNLISHSYKILSEIFYDNKDYKNAFGYLTKHKNLQDSLFNIEKERALAEIEAKYQTNKKDSEILLLKTKTESQRKQNILLYILIFVFAAGILMLFLLLKLKSTALKRQRMILEKEKIIHRQEKKIAQQEKQLLQEQLESKNRELASKALEMIRYNDAISGIIEKLESLTSISGKESPVTQPIKNIIRELENRNKQNIWSEFEKIFKNIHTDFYNKLLKICPDLTATEIKTAALLKLNLTTKEIAAITFKSEAGIKTTRYRLRKKLKLSGDDKLVPFLMKI